MTAEVRRAALFGKLPAHGDFVARGLDPAGHAGLDRWLSASLAEAQGVHGAAFADRYDRAPPWRHAAPGADDASVGALVLSVDAAGRRFPLFAQVGGLAGWQAEDAAAMVEGVLCRALVEGWRADDVVAALEALAGFASGAVPAAGWWTAGGGDEAALFAPAHLAGERPAELMRTMLTPHEASAGA